MPSIPRCRAIPLPDEQVSFDIDGTERLRWHYNAKYPRPFFFPFLGPSGSTLTRIGHPGAPNHDHHRSVWFAHHKVLGINFWADGTTARVRQTEWIAYEDGDDEARMAVKLAWEDGHDPQPLLTQELIIAVIPGEADETFLEVQTTLVPTAEQLEFQQTNFGIFAVRVAANISEHFGGGRLTNSHGATGEPAIFGEQSDWMDYSGTAPSGGTVPGGGTEGITYFDHPANPSYPSRWHVREDGWMNASLCYDGPQVTTRENPLSLRYLLHAHAGPLDPTRATDLFTEFAARPFLKTSKSTRKHEHFQIDRVPYEVRQNP